MTPPDGVSRRLLAMPRMAPLVLGGLALVLWVAAITSADFSKMGLLGLETILGPAYWLGLAVAIGAFCGELVRPSMREGVMAALVAVLVLYVFGTACAIEPTASLATSYIHAGFVQFIYAHGYALNGFEAEFSWPGAFSMFAIVVSAMGLHSALDLLRWFPFAIELSYLAPLLVIARRCGVNRRAGWLGVALFYLTNWIYQDYFSPQGLNLLFFLAVVALVLWVWEPVPLAQPAPPRLVDRARSGLSALRPARLLGNESRSVLAPRRQLAVLFVLVVMIAASAMSHQLTPYAILLALVALLLTRRLGRPELVVITALLAFGWLNLGASDYWIGHLSDIFQFGQLSSLISSNVASRVTGSPSHLMIIELRILLTIALFAVAAIGALRRATTSRSLELLAVSQFLVLGGQSYGGEGLLRVALLSGPFASLLAASAILPTRTGPLPAILERRVELRPLRVGVPIPWPRRRLWVGLAAFCVALVFGVVTTVVRGGNDDYESFSNGEVAAAAYVYAHLSAGQTVGITAPYVPLGYEEVGSVNVFDVVPSTTVPLQGAIGKIYLKRRPKLIFLSRAQAAWGVILGGYPPTWQASLEAYLLAHGYVVVRTFGSEATILQSTTTLPRPGPAARATSRRR